MVHVRAGLGSLRVGEGMGMYVYPCVRPRVRVGMGVGVGGRRHAQHVRGVVSICSSLGGDAMSAEDVDLLGSPE